MDGGAKDLTKNKYETKASFRSKSGVWFRIVKRKLILNDICNLSYIFNFDFTFFQFQKTHSCRSPFRRQETILYKQTN